MVHLSVELEQNKFVVFLNEILLISDKYIKTLLIGTGFKLFKKEHLIKILNCNCFRKEIYNAGQQKCRFILYFDNEVAYATVVDQRVKLQILSIYAGTTMVSELPDYKLSEPGFFY
jgi:hypothetical protein